MSEATRCGNRLWRLRISTRYTRRWIAYSCSSILHCSTKNPSTATFEWSNCWNNKPAQDSVLGKPLLDSKIFPTSIGVRILVTGFIIILYKSIKDLKDSWAQGIFETIGTLQLGYSAAVYVPTATSIGYGSAVTMEIYMKINDAWDYDYDSPMEMKPSPQQLMLLWNWLQ